MRSGRRALVIAFSLALSACGSSKPSPPEKGDTRNQGPHREALAVLDRLAGAMRNDRADRLVDVADPVHGLTFWGQPGVCAAPMFQVAEDEQGRLSSLARKRIGSAPPHYFDPDGYWREVAETIRAGLRVVKVNAGSYELPSEDGLDRAPAWASLDTRNVAPGNRELSCLDEEQAGDVKKAKRAEYRYRFRAERGYSSVTVFLVEHKGALRVAHVIQIWHYDA